MRVTINSHTKKGESRCTSIFPFPRLFFIPNEGVLEKWLCHVSGIHSHIWSLYKCICTDTYTSSFPLISITDNFVIHLWIGSVVLYLMEINICDLVGVN